MEVGIGTNYIDIFLGVVGPQVPKGTGHSQKGYFVNVGGATYRACMASRRTVPKIKLQLKISLKQTDFLRFLSLCV